MKPATKGDTVEIRYKGTLEDGTVFDSTLDRAPVRLKLGDQRILPALERALEGMSPGDAKTVQIASGEAFGQHHDQLIGEIDRLSLDQHRTPRVGMRLYAPAAGNRMLFVTVIEVRDTTVLVDANHPLAGRDVTFTISLLGIE